MNRIVVVEDSLLLRKGIIYTTDWKKLNCEVVGEADNGYGGCTIIEELQPDIVITDIRMPGIDGIKMIERLQGKTNAMFVIITAFNEFEYAYKALKMGVVDYLSKPIDDAEFYSVLKQTCERVEKIKQYEKLQNQLDTMEDSRIMFFKEYMAGNQAPQGNYVQAAVQFIQENYQNDIGIREIAQSLTISESRLSHVFKQNTGYTVGDYVQNVRMKQACLLLSDPTVKVYEVAGQVGFKDQRYFSVMFKKLVGMSPREFQNTFTKQEGDSDA